MLQYFGSLLYLQFTVQGRVSADYSQEFPPKLIVKFVVQGLFELKTEVARSIEISAVSFKNLDFQIEPIHRPDPQNLTISSPGTGVFQVIRFIGDLIFSKTQNPLTSSESMQMLDRDFVFDCLEIFRGTVYDRSRQVLINVLLNGIQAMPDGGLLEISSSLSTTAKSVLVDVRDSGECIQGDLDRIFDPFFTTRPEGTGLGLAVSHQLVEKHGGVLSANNNEEKGMTFRLELPRQSSER